jgi:hypothetical protein
MNNYEKNMIENCIILLIRDGINSKKTVEENLTKLLIENHDHELELNELKEVVMEFLTFDGQSGNDQVLKAIKAYRKLRSMMGLEGDNHGNETQTSLFDDNQ